MPAKELQVLLGRIGGCRFVLKTLAHAKDNLAAPLFNADLPALYRKAPYDLIDYLRRGGRGERWCDEARGPLYIKAGFMLKFKGF